VEASTQRIEKLISSGKLKIDKGSEVASQCGQSLESILTNVSDVNLLMKEISVSSSEQSSGVKEITVAMQELDHLNNENSNVAQGTASLATVLKSSAKNLNSVVFELTHLVDGGNKRSNPTSETFEVLTGNKIVPLFSDDDFSQSSDDDESTNVA